MFYEECCINGTWHWRGTPQGPWMAMNNHQLHGKLAKLERELAECRKDAERYRWLRDNGTALTRIIRMPAEDWDAAIDAAMKGGE